MNENVNLQEQLLELQQNMEQLEKKLAKQKKINKILMERVERSVDSAGSSYSMFEQNILLQQHVDKRTKEIEERKQAENALKESKERIKMLNKIIRHDLSNDLAVINSAVKIFKRKNSDISLLDEIEKRTKKSLNAIAGYRKSESYINSNTGLNELELSDVINNLIVEYPEIKFKIEGVCRVFGDDTLYSVLENLVSNSIKHGKASQIDINISEEDDICRMEFADNGTGIPDEIKEKVFDEGFQHGESGNTGIGLHIVKNTIESFGGEIKVEDNEPNGTVFLFTLRKAL